MRSIENNLKYNLLGSLKDDELWLQFMEAIAEELELERIHIFEKQDLFNPYVGEQDKLLDLSEMFGYNPNLILDNTTEMIKSEYLSIPYRIRFKSTYDGYYFIFKQINASGDIYNYYYDGNKLIKAMEYDTSLEKILNGSYVYGTIFTFNEPDKNFSTTLGGETVYLDNEVFLDTKVGNYWWYLDKGMDIKPTKHLGIEYYPMGLMTDDEGNECILNKYWFNYLEVGVEYNRRVPIVPHLGLQLSAVFKENATYDFLTPSNEYTIDDLKLKVATSFNFNKKFITTDAIELDNSVHLDALQEWTLDTSSSGGEGIKSEDFKYICCGDGSVSLPNKEHGNIFKYNDFILFYTFDDNDNLSYVEDYSRIANKGELIGDTIKVEGITSKTINFNGSTYVKSTNDINVSSEDTFSINFWINPNNRNYIESTYDMCIFELGDFLKCTYNYSDREMKVVFNESTTSTISNINYSTNYYINIEITNRMMNVYVNGELKSTTSLSAKTSNVYLYIGNNSTLSNYYIGIIDSFYILNKFISESDKLYIYNNKQSIVTHLGNFLARYSLSHYSEIYDINKIRLIQSHVNALDVNDEFIFKTDDVMDTSTVYIGSVKRTPLLEKYFKYTYTKEDTTQTTITANESGEFFTEDGKLIRGKIDYDSGAYTIYPYNREYITDLVLDIFDDGQLINPFTVQLQENIESMTLKGTVVTENLTYTFTSAPNGELSAPTQYLNGNIDYEHGILTLNFLTEDVKSVTISYSYFEDLGMLPNSDVFVDYKLKEGYITEVGIENANHELLAYMTFPKVEFNTIQDFISVGFYMLK